MGAAASLRHDLLKGPGCISSRQMQCQRNHSLPSQDLETPPHSFAQSDCPHSIEAIEAYPRNKQVMTFKSQVGFWF